jgi:hypothetical protein
MASLHAGALGRGEGGSDVETRRPYERPLLVVLGSVAELTRAGLTGQNDGVGFEELGGT